MSDEDRNRGVARYRVAVDDGGADPSTSTALLAASPWLPAAGRALDLAGGAGGAALALADRGLEVDAARALMIRDGLGPLGSAAPREGIVVEGHG